MKFNDRDKTVLDSKEIRDIRCTQESVRKSVYKEPTIKRSGFFFRQTVITKEIETIETEICYRLYVNMLSGNGHWLTYSDPLIRLSDLNKASKHIT